MKTSGYKDYRLNPNDPYCEDEINAIEVFNREHSNNMDFIVFGMANGTGRFANDTLSEREVNIVLGLIQWLGTPVGKYYLSQINLKK